MTKLTSETFRLLRLPLAILVVVVHAYYAGFGESDVLNFTSPIESIDFFNWFRYFFSQVLGQSAVPTFFLMSGFLFFAKAEENLKWSFYKKQWQKRIWTLLVPYLIWNVIVGLFLYLRHTAGILPEEKWLRLVESIRTYNFFWRANEWGGGIDIFGHDIHPFFSPIHGALWFVRDLIIVCLLSPAIACLLKKSRGWFLLVPAFFFIGSVNIGCYIPASALFFFSVGAWFAIAKIDLGNVARRAFPYVMPVAIVFMFVSLVRMGETSLGTKVDYRLSQVFIVAFYVGLAAVFAGKKMSAGANHAPSSRLDSWRQSVVSYASANTFYIYVAHGPFGLTVTAIFFRVLNSKLGLVDNAAAYLVEYIITPFAAIAVCLTLLWVVDKIAPRVVGVCIGRK